LYRRFRPYKAPEDYHIVDTAVARRHNEELAAKRACLLPAKQMINMPYVPLDLKVWFTLNWKHGVNIFEEKMPPIIIVRRGCGMISSMIGEAEETESNNTFRYSAFADKKECDDRD
jgi:hypothetical protein